MWETDFMTSLELQAAFRRGCRQIKATYLSICEKEKHTEVLHTSFHEKGTEVSLNKDQTLSLIENCPDKNIDYTERGIFT